jgi:hypothetical protein
MKAQIQKIQQFLKIKDDGVFGPITTKAVADKLGTLNSIKSIQTFLKVTPDGEVGPITIGAILDKFNITPTVSNNSIKVVDIAKTQVGIYENAGRNHGDGIAKYWTATNYPDGYKNREPYCAACMCWCIKEAGIFTEAERPKTAAAFGFESWADNLPNKTDIIRKPKKIKKGQLVVFSFSHIGIATSDSNASGVFSTVEANTGASGGRDGDGVYAKSRNINVVRSAITIL